MKRFVLSIIIGNSLGASLTFFYFSYIETMPQQNLGGPTIYHFIYFIVATSLIFMIITPVVRRLFRPLYGVIDGETSMDDLDVASAEQMKRRTLNMVPLTAGFNLLAWLLAGFLFGFLQPAIFQSLFDISGISIIDCLRAFMGITFIGGSITTLFVYFFCERIWRTKLVQFLPTGELSQVKGTFRLSVKIRLLIVFLMISLVPLTLLGVGSYIKASALLSADSAMGRPIISSLLKMIIFFVTVGGAASVGLSVIVSQSVFKPLREMELAMKKVAQGNFDAHIHVVSNDEIGAVGEGFNRMIQGLKESESIKESFGKYVSKEIRDEILRGKVPLDGEMKRVTLLFSDLRNFTPFVESTHPKHVITIMNQYFSEMTEAIKENRGLVLQYVGDEIEAVFGAPVSYEDHPDMAVQAALEMRRRLILLNQNFEKQGFKPLHHGIGIHTGAALAGNIGSKERVSYALVGDTVNLASRIEGLTKEFSCDIILSQTAHDLLASSFPMERLPAIKVKGKKDEVTVYKLGGEN